MSAPVTRWTRRLVVWVGALVLVAGGARAQISTGGKHGGLPGGGGPGSSGGPGQSTGGDPLVEEQLHYHVLNRVAYGPSSEDQTLLRTLGVDRYLRLQLRPGRIAESQLLTDRLAALPPATTAVGDPMWVWESLYTDYFLRATYSRRQLQEVLTEFWQNHFDTGLDEGSGGFVGQYSSHRIDAADNFLIAFYDGLRPTSYFGRYDGSRFNVVGVDYQRGAGLYTSLGVDSTGRAWVAYYVASSGELRVRPEPFTRWDSENVVDVGDDLVPMVERWVSINLDAADNPVLAYYDAASGALELARHDGSDWIRETVDDKGDVGRFVSLVLDAGDNPHIAYYEATGGELRYAHFDTAWTIDVVDTDGDVGAFASLALTPGSGEPAIAYYDADGQDLKLASKSAGSWTTELVDAAGDVGSHASLAFSPAGLGAISYHDAGSYDLKVARHDGVAWQSEVVEVPETAENIQGEWSSLAFDSAGNPRVSYYNGSRFSLFYAYKFDPDPWGLVQAYTRGDDLFLYTGWEKEETEAFRQRVLGSFRELLDVSAKSPAMMLFLNNNENVAGAGNENYARELLELHTLGVDGGYTQKDVEEVARVFTGWGLVQTSPRCDFRQGDFCYNHLAHDPTAKQVLGQTIPAVSSDPANWAEGMAEGEGVLDRLASHPSTASFVCRKLVEKFVSDTVPEELWEACKSSFLVSEGQLRRVLETILFSEAFRDPAHFTTKIKTPMEYVVGATRALEGDTDGWSLWYFATLQGMPLFRNSVPTGYSELGGEWLNSNSLLQRWKFADLLPHLGAYTVVYPYDMASSQGLEGAGGVVDYFAQKLLRGALSAQERELLVDYLDGGTPGSFRLNDPSAPPRVRDMVGFMLGYPEAMKQ